MLKFIEFVQDAIIGLFLAFILLTILGYSLGAIK
jgi:hypothetical protein